MRDDAIGLWWNEPPRVSARAKDTGPRPLPPIPETNWSIPEGVDAFPSLANRGAIALDVETKDVYLKEKGPGFARGDAYVVGVAIGTEDGYRQYYPVAHEIGPNMSKRAVFGWLNEELSREGQPKIGARLLYDLEALHYSGVKVAGPFYDVQVAEPLLDETRLAYALEILARARLHEGKRQNEMLAWLKKAFGDEANIKKNIWRAPSSIVGPYGESDVDLPLRLFEVQREELQRQNLWDLFILESKLIPILLAMRLRGVPVDIPHAENLLVSLKEKYQEALDRIKDVSGVNADVWAPDSLAKVFDKVGVKYPRTAKTKKPSFRKEWLLNHPHPVAKMIQDARHMDKFRGTFVEGYILDGHVNGKIYGQFHQLRSDEGGTVSGRFSSSIPNLQNIPTRTEEGNKIRQAFIAEAGCKWWKYDWSQIEYRLIAHYAVLTKQPGAEEVRLRYLNEPDVDYHQMVADMTGLPRKDAKNLNFGLAYGQGIPLLCANLGVDIPEGMRIMETYHDKAPFIRPLSNAVSARANTQGLITTLLGRKRRFNVWERGNSKKRGRLSNEEDTNEYVSETHKGAFAHSVTDEHLKRIGWSDEDILNLDLREPDNKRYLSALRSAGWRRAFLHKALNALIQGSAADVMKKAMVQCWEDGVFDEHLLGAPHLTVHDELDGSYDEMVTEQVQALAHVKHVMETCVQLTIPMRADGGTGLNWGAIA